MIQGALFTEYFLTEGIKETPEWKTADPTAVAAFSVAAEATYRAFPVASKPSETQTEDDLIFPVLSALGWTRDFWIAQVPAARKGRADIPDMLLFGTADDKI